ncbi:Hypothetical predicted protein [Xyrichtys novacula]|uniref:Uncharacterized protein n=1 Tax=Xyrichtys novacula TaxID=13765 RepID=A0AAV1HCC0_XYRNO|nr:Hypothetical predicted protein [Xyrichtys novacula]
MSRIKLTSFSKSKRDEELLFTLAETWRKNNQSYPSMPMVVNTWVKRDYGFTLRGISNDMILWVKSDCVRPHCHHSATSSAEVKAKPDAIWPLLFWDQPTKQDKPTEESAPWHSDRY